MKDARLFQVAKQVAEMSDFKKCKIGCVVVYKGKIIGMGFNTNKTHPLQKEYNKLRFKGDSNPHSMHAEIHALMPLRNTDIEWNKVSIYVYRISKKYPGCPALSRPCPSCMAYMKSLDIKNIYYTTYESPVHEVLDIN